MRSFNFVINTLSTFVSFIIVWWFLGFNFIWMLLYLCFVIVSFDYLYQLNTRRWYYQRQKEKEWREIIHQIIPLKILVSEFDSRTMRLNLQDCSSAAQAYIKERDEDEDKYNKFLERVVLNIETSKIKFNQFQEYENLKKYLTHRFIMIDNFIKTNKKLIMKNINSRISVASKNIRKQFTFQAESHEKNLNKGISKLKSKIQVKSDYELKAIELAQLDEMEGYYCFDEADIDQNDPTKKKKIKVKVAYYSVQNSKPLLVISIEDESLREDIEFYKEEKQKSDQFITNTLENYRSTLIKNLSFFNQGWYVVEQNFQELFRNSLILVNRSYVIYDYFLFLRNRRLYKGVSHQQQLSLMKSDPFNFANMLKYMVDIFNNIDVVCELDNDIEIYNDQKRIKQVFISLITNCIKTSISAITINISEKMVNDFKAIFVRFDFYKDEDNPMEGILDHLDGTDSQYVNQIELVVLQEIIRCIGPFDIIANSSPNGCCEIEFALYEDLRKFKEVFNILDKENDDLSRNYGVYQRDQKKTKSFKAEAFVRKNKRMNKTFFDLKNFKQMQSIVVPRGSKLVSSETRNQLQAFLTLKDKRGDLIDDEDDDDEEEEVEEDDIQYILDEDVRENFKVQEENSSLCDEQQIEKLHSVVEQKEQHFGKKNQMSGRLQNNSFLKNSDIENNLVFKGADQDEETSTKRSKSNRSRSQNVVLDEKRAKDLRSFNRLGSQGIQFLQSSNDNISIGSRKNGFQKNLSIKERDPLPFIPKKGGSSFTSLRQNTIEEYETTDRKQVTYRSSSRVKSQLCGHQVEQITSQRSLTQNVTYALYTDTYRSDRNLKVHQNNSQHSIFDYSKYNEKTRNNSAYNQNDDNTEYYDDNDDIQANGCNLTFQIEKSEIEIHDFVPRLK